MSAQPLSSIFCRFWVLEVERYLYLCSQILILFCISNKVRQRQAFNVANWHHWPRRTQPLEKERLSEQRFLLCVCTMGIHEMLISAASLPDWVHKASDASIDSTRQSESQDSQRQLCQISPCIAFCASDLLRADHVSQEECA